MTPRRFSNALLTSLLPLLTACSRGPATAVGPRSFIPGEWPLLAKVQTVMAPRAMVVSGSPLASEVGIEILKRGGNAVDAAVAVGFALAVVHPEAGNIGGGGFMVLRFADGRVTTLDYRETAPARASRDMYLDSTGAVTDQSVTGHLSAGVPGSVAGMAEAARRYGTMPLGDLIQPAIILARDGFVIDSFRHRSIAGSQDRLARFETSRQQFLTGGAPPQPGSLLVQPDLARTLQAIADSGPRVFYEGYIADLIEAEMERGGGIISKAGLASYRSVWREPITITYRGHTIYSMPPASSGGITMAEILNILEGYDPLPPFASAEHVHLLTEAMRRAFMDRNRYLGDPAYVEMPVARLLLKPYAAALRAGIDLTRASRTPGTTASSPGREGIETTHYSVVDEAGNAASVTTTLNNSYGSAVTVAGAGFLLNDEMDDFTAAPGRPNLYGLIQGQANAIQPGKRMLSAMTPSIVLDRQGQLMMVVGTPGGPTIITTVAEVISGVIDHHMSLAEALAAPRFHHQALPDTLRYEPDGLLPATVGRLEAMGHAVQARSGYSGDVAAIQRTANGWVGVADPRRGAGAAGY